MKYSKKHPKANLENYSKLFVQLGLVLTLGIVYLLIQNKTFTNEIIVLDRGEIIERGTHEQLVKNKGRYFRLIKS